MGHVSGSLTLICSIPTIDPNSLSAWQVGPAPLEYTHHETGMPARADVTGRTSHFRQRTISELYGDADQRIRLHRIDPEMHLGGSRVEAVEVLLNRHLETPICLIHLDISTVHPDNICATVQRLVRTSSPNIAAEIARLFGAPPGTRPKTLFHIAFVHLTHDVPTLITDDSTVPRSAQWLRALSLAVDPKDPSSIPLDLEDPELTLGTLYLSATWRAQVSLRGAAFVGWSERGEAGFLTGQAGTYVKTLYADAILLGLLQLHSLEALADRISCIDIDADYDELETLQGELLKFRQNLWWQHISPTEISNRLLLEFQRRHRLEELFGEVGTEINQFSARLAQRAAEQTNSALNLITLVGLPIGVAITGLQIYFSEGWGHAGLTVGVAAVLAALGLFNSNVRESVKYLFRSRR